MINVLEVLDVEVVMTNVLERVECGEIFWVRFRSSQVGGTSLS